MDRKQELQLRVENINLKLAMCEREMKELMAQGQPLVDELNAIFAEEKRAAEAAQKGADDAPAKE